MSLNFISQEIGLKLASVKKQSDPSIKQIDSTIGTIFKNCFKIEKFDETVLGRCDEIIKYVTKKYENINTRKNKLFHISHVYECIDGHDEEILKKYKKLANDVGAESRNMRTYEVGNPDKMVSDDMKDICFKKVVALYDKEHETPEYGYTNATLIKLRVAALYRFLPPLRTQDYLNMIVDDTCNEVTPDYLRGYNIYRQHPKSTNYKKFIIRSGKTINEENDEERIIDVPKELVNYLFSTDELYDTLSKNEIKYMIPNVRDIKTPQSQSAFSHYLKGIYGGSCNQLRNSFISETVVDGLMDGPSRKEIARVMGHSDGTQQTFYTKHSTILHPELKQEKINNKIEIETKTENENGDEDEDEHNFFNDDEHIQISLDNNKISKISNWCNELPPVRPLSPPLSPLLEPFVLPYLPPPPQPQQSENNEIINNVTNINTNDLIKNETEKMAAELNNTINKKNDLIEKIKLLKEQKIIRDKLAKEKMEIQQLEAEMAALMC